MELQGVDHVAFAVSDQEASIAWYRTVLGLNEEHREWLRHPAMLMRGGSGVALFAADGKAPGNDEPRFLHLAFRVDRASFAEAQEASQSLRSHSTSSTTAPRTRSTSTTPTACDSS